VKQRNSLILSFRLAHLSDLHVGPLPAIRLRQLAGKRLTGYWNWHSSRKTIHDMAVLDQVVAEIAGTGADHVACTGDLANLGLPVEFETARHALEALGGPEQVSLIPGNHDAYVGESLPAMHGALSPYMRGDAGPGFPYLRRRDGVALIGVNSGVTTFPFMATGAVGAAQAEALAGLLRRTAAEGLTRVVMIHHPPHFHGTRWGRRLNDAARIEALLAAEGAELVIHGHNHRHSVAWLKGPRRPVPVVGVASASAVPGSPAHQAAWHLYTLTGTGAVVTIDVHVHGRQPDGRFAESAAFRLDPEVPA
jgi:3',5'-cyclic AMP phosphodiesterase CpdA